VRQARRQGRPACWNDALAAFKKACAEGPIAIVDGWPRRAASAVFEDFARRQGGSYRIVSGAEERALEPYENWAGVPAASLGYDLENARTILSFGAPLLDGWGAPGRLARLWSERAAGRAEPELRLIQVEPSLSRTAGCAWRWVRVTAGSEAAFATGLARVLLEERLVAARGPMPSMTLAECAAQTGLNEEAIRELARMLKAGAPAVAIAADNEPSVAALNVILGAAGARGGIVRRTQRTRSHAAANSLTGAFRAVLIDATAPWDFEPQCEAEVFRLAAWDGGSRADWLLPAPGFLEEPTDIPTSSGAARETYALAQAMVAPVTEVRSAAQFLARVDANLPAVEEVIRGRCRELFQARHGNLHRERVTPVSSLASAKEVEEELRKGAVWVGEAAREGGLHCRLDQWPWAAAIRPSRNWTDAWVPGALPPLAAKLYQESSLREPPAGKTRREI